MPLLSTSSTAHAAPPPRRRLCASEAAPQRPRLYVPLGIAWSEAAAWQAKGYAVVRAVVAAARPRTEAKRLNCSHALIDGDAVPL